MMCVRRSWMHKRFLDCKNPNRKLWSIKSNIISKKSGDIIINNTMYTVRLQQGLLQTVASRPWICSVSVGLSLTHRVIFPHREDGSELIKTPPVCPSVSQQLSLEDFRGFVILDSRQSVLESQLLHQINRLLNYEMKSDSGCWSHQSDLITNFSHWLLQTYLCFCHVYNLKHPSKMSSLVSKTPLCAELSYVGEKLDSAGKWLTQGSKISGSEAVRVKSR